MKNKKEENKYTFSKILAIFSCVLVVLVFILFFIANILLMAGKLENFDFSGFMYAIPSTCGLCGATITFYYNKAKLENSLKIRFAYIKNLIQLKKRSKLYSQDDLTNFIDDKIYNAESDIENDFAKNEEDITYEQN